MNGRALLGAALLTLACQTTGGVPSPDHDGVYRLELYRGQGAIAFTMSLGWAEGGYRGFLESPTRSLELVAVAGEGNRLNLRFEGTGGRIVLALAADEEGLRGTWQEMGRGGVAKATRVTVGAP